MENIEKLKNCISMSNHVPLYFQIEEKIREFIEKGDFLPGMRLTAENELSLLLEVSRNTIRKVYQDLTAEGVVEKQQGKGTFVSQPKISHKFVTVVSFTEELIARGIKPSSKLLTQEIRKADKEVAEKLKIKEGDPIIYIERLRYGNGKLLGYNLSRVPLFMCPGLEKLKIGDESLYLLIEKMFGHVVVKAERSLETIPTDKVIAKCLNIKEGFPVLKTQGVVFDKAGIPFDNCLEYYIH